MALKRVRLELTVERELPAADRAPGRARLTASYENDGGEPSPGEVANALATISMELDDAIAALGPRSSGPSRVDRPLAELIETYHPRQTELVDLLADEGEVTAGEASSLREHLGQTPVSYTPAAPSARGPMMATTAPSDDGGVPITDRPLAALPLSNDRTSAVSRPVDHLIQEYRIETLKQAGAVRARRQISYDEYMALKRHFAVQVATSDAPAVPTS